MSRVRGLGVKPTAVDHSQGGDHRSSNVLALAGAGLRLQLPHFMQCARGPFRRGAVHRRSVTPVDETTPNSERGALEGAHAGVRVRSGKTGNSSAVG
jgi:hypothetical protein